jgi:UDP-glucose 4-epimerase
VNTYLISGATGFVGRRLFSKLLSDLHQVIPISRCPIPGIDTVVHDFEVDDISSISLQEVDVIIHLAGFAHDRRDASEVKHLYRAINVDATVKLAKHAEESGVKRFVFVSSVKAGGGAIAGQSVTENDQSEPVGIYGKTKREAELKLLEIVSQSDMHISIVRPALVYGPDVKGNLRLMLSWIEKGWFPPLPETGNCRSMIHVDDLVRALLLVANDDRANGEIFIATDGKAHSSREIYKAMCGLLGKSVPQWSVPKLVFDFAALMSNRLKYNVDKLLGDEFYSSEKLQAFGFKVQRSLSEMNETSF